jgi:hypothetical protein
VTGRQFLGAVASAGVGFVLRDSVLSPSSSVERIALLIAAYLTCYLVIVVGFFRLTTPLWTGWSVLRDVLSPRRAFAENRSSRPVLAAGVGSSEGLATHRAGELSD